MPAHSMLYCSPNRNCLSVLGALQPIDKLNPTFISHQFGNFGNVGRKNMAQRLGRDIPIGVETAVLKDNQPIQQEIETTMKPKNTALKVGINRMIGDVSDTLSGGRMHKSPLGNTNDRLVRMSGGGIFDRIGQAINFISEGSVLKEGVSDILEAGQELAFGPIGTYLSNVASEKFNKNPNYRQGFPGEKHALIDTPWGLTRASYLGPGTNLLARLERGDPPVDGPDGLDALAKVHDIAYGLARTAEDVRKADDDFLDGLAHVTSSTKMKSFVMGLFKAKKLAEDVGFLDPSKFAPDIKQELSGMGFDEAMAKAGSFSAENVVMGAGMRGVGIKENIRDVSKLFIGKKGDLTEPLRQLRNIAFSVPEVKEKVEEIVEEFLPGQQLKQRLVAAAKKIPTKRADRAAKRSRLKGKGFSAENVVMGAGMRGAGVPKQDEFSGHILAGNVPKTKSAYNKGQPGGQLGIIASIIASTVVPELIKFVGKKIAGKPKKKKKKGKKKR